MSRPLPRRLVLLLPLVAAACGPGVPIRRDFPPLRYDFLTSIRLNVATIEIVDPPPAPLTDIDRLAPVLPVVALHQMAVDRLRSGGSAGRAVFVIDRASIVSIPGGLSGTLAVHLDVLTTEGTRAGFAEARVSRQRLSTDRDEDIRGVLYDMTRDMMADMNVEFEFQVHRSLRDWVQDTTTVPPPPPVEEQDLPPPGR